MVFTLTMNNIAKSFKVRNDKPVIDDYAFQCHYKLTTNILLVFCVLLTSINLIGNPIQCITNASKKNADIQKVVNTYCWMSGSFTYRNKPDFRQLNRPKDDGDSIRYNSYYQWVPFMLFFQAIAFYVPHWIWKMWEGGKIRMITKDISGFCINLNSAEDRRMKQNKLVQYFVESFHMHSTYAIGYILCEVINTVNIIGNIYITNKFLGGSFLSYGIEVFKYDPHRGDQFNPMEVTFPRLTKCNFFKYGPSGTVQNMDAMCILAQNVLNEKIYLFLWIWFFILAILSMSVLAYRIIILVQITKNEIIWLKMFKFTNDEQIVSKLITKFQIGDYLLVDFIEKNVNSIQFKEIMEEICSRLNMNSNNNVIQYSL